MKLRVFIWLAILPLILSFKLHQDELTVFLERLKQHQNAVKSLSANFVQVKKNPLFVSDQKATGKFYFVKPDKIRWEEVTPAARYFIINGEEFIQFDGVKTTVSSTSGMQVGALKSFILKTVDGSIFNDKSFETQLKQSGSTVVLLLTPLSKRAKKHLLNVEMQFDNKSLFLKKLILRESEQVTTELTYSEQKRDLLLSNQLFKSQK